MASALSTRPYQIVVWGATGFTGRLVCEHIAKDYQGRIKWAMAGRDKRKLELVRQELVELNPECQNVPIILADAQNQSSLRELAAQTNVVVATAGPFSLYGSEMVAASVEEGTHYCDITGEVPWVRKMRAKHHEAAAAKKVKIVNCCGYDSIPSDLGALLVVDFMKNKLGKDCGQMYMLIQPGSGGVSGGTVASGKLMADTTPPEEMNHWKSDPYYLVEDPRKKGKDTVPSKSPLYNSYAKVFMCPWVMEAINSRIVHLSNALMPQPYGKDFRYYEAQAIGSVVMAWLMAFAGKVVDKVFSVGALWTIASRFLPKPGQGPSRTAMTNGYWWNEVIALTEEPSGATPQVVRARVGDANRDPGYRGTSRMILEAALCLCLQQKEQEAAGLATGGVLTPATAMGMLLVERLRAAGLTFEITEPLVTGETSGVVDKAAAAAAVN